MNMKETKALVEVVAQLCPAQRINEFTAEAWQIVLADVDARAALAAVRTLGATHRFIAPADIVAQVEAGAADEMQRAIIPEVDVDPDDVLAWLAAYRAKVAEVRAQIEAGTWREPAVDVEVAAASARRQRAMVGQVRSMPALEGVQGAAGGAERPSAYRQGRAALSGHSEQFWADRERANTVPCVDGCGAPVGVSCHLDGVPLSRTVAHYGRMVVSGVVAPVRDEGRAVAEKFKAMIDAGEIR